MTLRNEREANAQLLDGAQRTCPPCTGRCHQGRACSAPRRSAGPLPRTGDVPRPAPRRGDGWLLLALWLWPLLLVAGFAVLVKVLS